MFSLFAFQSARVSVVRTGQPTLTSLRAIQGATTRTAPATTAAPSSSERLDRSSGRATKTASTSGSSASRAFPRIARPAAAPSARASQRTLLLRDDQREQRHDRDEQPVQDLAVQVHVVPDEERVQRRDRRPDDTDPKRDGAATDLEHDDRGQSCERDVCDADDEPVTLEDLVEAGEEPGVQRLRVSRRSPGKEPERPARDEGLCEAVALLDELLEDRSALREEDDEARNHRGGEHDRGGSAVVSRYGRARSRRDGGVEPGALPELEHEQAPEAVTVVALAARVLVEHALDDVRPQLLARSGSRIQERVSGELAGAGRGTSRRGESRTRSCGVRRAPAGPGLRTHVGGRPSRAGPRTAGSRAATPRAPAPRGRAAASGARARSPSMRGRPSRADRRGDRCGRRAAGDRWFRPRVRRRAAPRPDAAARERPPSSACTARRAGPLGRSPSACRTAHAPAAPQPPAGVRRETGSSAGVAGRQGALAELGRRGSAGAERRRPARPSASRRSARTPRRTRRRRLRSARP